MKLPQRPETHLIEAESWRLLQSLAPRNWIVREATERDYGIDAYIEVTSKGEVTGDLFLAQLKGVKNRKWKAAGEFEKCRSPSVKAATVNYWMRLPVPVFLMTADLSRSNIYWCNVKNWIRTNFADIGKQESISFGLHSAADLKSETGRMLLGLAYLREKDHENFLFHVTSLISNAHRFSEFIAGNVGRDSFMEVEADRHLEFRALYTTCQNVAFHLTDNWDMPSLEDLYNLDQEEWKDPYIKLHERTLTVALQRLAAIYLGLVRDSIALVSNKQAAYWEQRSPEFFGLCWSGELDWNLKAIERDMQGATWKAGHSA